MCAQKNERLTHLYMRIFLLVLFPDFHVVVFFFIALSSCAEFYFLIFLWALKLHFLFLLPILLLLMMRQIKQSATNQAMNKLKQIEQCVSYKTNEATANWTDLTICNKLSNN